MYLIFDILAQMRKARVAKISLLIFMTEPSIWRLRNGGRKFYITSYFMQIYTLAIVSPDQTFRQQDGIVTEEKLKVVNDNLLDLFFGLELNLGIERAGGSEEHGETLIFNKQLKFLIDKFLRHGYIFFFYHTSYFSNTFPYSFYL